MANEYYKIIGLVVLVAFLFVAITFVVKDVYPTFTEDIKQKRLDKRCSDVYGDGWYYVYYLGDPVCTNRDGTLRTAI